MGLPPPYATIEQYQITENPSIFYVLLPY